jgi:hypothetical protein
MRTKIVLGLLAAVAFPATTWAQAVATPDRREYLKKMTEELIRSAYARDASAKADLFIRLAEERAKEMERLQEDGRTEHHEALGRSYEKLLTRGAVGSIERAAAQGADLTAAVGRYAEATTRHRAMLERVLAKTPPQARKGLLQALEASRNGHEQAIQAHERGKGKFERRDPAGGGRRAEENPEKKPEKGPSPDKGTPEQPGKKPEEKGKPEKEKGPGGPPSGPGKGS